MDSSSSPILTLTGIVLGHDVPFSLTINPTISISNLFNEILISLNLTSSNLIVCRIDDRSLLSSDPRIRPSPSTIDDAVLRLLSISTIIKPNSHQLAAEWFPAAFLGATDTLSTGLEDGRIHFFVLIDDDDAPQLQHEQQGDVDVSPPAYEDLDPKSFRRSMGFALMSKAEYTPEQPSSSARPLTSFIHSEENQKESEHINQLSHPTDHDSITTNPVRGSAVSNIFQSMTSLSRGKSLGRALPEDRDSYRQTYKPSSPAPQSPLPALHTLLNQPPRSTSTPGTAYVTSPSSAPSATSHYPDLSPPSQNESLQAMEPPKLNHRSRSSSLSASKYQKTFVPSTQLQQQGIIPSQYMDNSTYDSTARPISGYHSTHRFEPFIHQQQVQQQHLVHGWLHSQSTPHINTPSFIDPSKSFGHSHHHHQPPLDPRKNFNWSPQHQHQQYQPLIIDAPPAPPKKSILKPSRTLHIDPPHRDLCKKKSVVSSDALFLSYASSSSPKPTVPGTGYGHILPAEPDASTEFGQYEVMQPLTPPDTPKGPFPFNRVSQGFVETVKVKHGRERSMDYGRGGYR